MRMHAWGKYGEKGAYIKGMRHGHGWCRGFATDRNARQVQAQLVFPATPHGVHAAVAPARR